MLARADTHTPVSYWMDLPVSELTEWIDTIVKLEEKQKGEVTCGPTYEISFKLGAQMAGNFAKNHDLSVWCPVTAEQQNQRNRR